MIKLSLSYKIIINQKHQDDVIKVKYQLIHSQPNILVLYITALQVTTSSPMWNKTHLLAHSSVCQKSGHPETLLRVSQAEVKVNGHVGSYLEDLRRIHLQVHSHCW